MKKVLFVCLGNICRSPTAEGIFREVVNNAGAEAAIQIDSAGTASWHTGKSPDARAQSAAISRGFDISHLRARQVTSSDLDEFDYILAMDKQNLSDLQALASDTNAHKLNLLLDHSQSKQFEDVDEVPDPYYDGEQGFQYVIDLIEDASKGLLNKILRLLGRTG